MMGKLMAGADRRRGRATSGLLVAEKFEKRLLCTRRTRIHSLRGLQVGLQVSANLADAV